MSLGPNATPETGIPHTRSIAALAVLVLFGLIGSIVFAAQPQPVTAATVSFSQCNNRGAGPGGAPLSVTCSVNIINSITPSGNSSIVQFNRTCTLNPCTGDIVNSSDVVNLVNQCNGSDNVGGSTMVCSVNVTNNITLTQASAATAITVNQCVGSGGGGGTDMTACIPSAQGSPTVVQCNGSGNGGGGKMTCNASGTISAAFPITVNQCNGSENGGGSFVTCTTSITTNITVVQAADTPVPSTPIPGAATPIPGAATPIPATPVPGAPVPPVFFPPAPPVFFPPAPPIFFPPAPPVIFQPPVAIPPVPIVVPPPSQPNTVPPVVVPPVTPPVAVPPVAPPNAVPPLPPQTGVVFPPEEGFRPPSSGDGGLVRSGGSRSILGPLIAWFLRSVTAE